MITIADAILFNINAEVNIKGDNLDTCEIEWMNGTAEISKGHKNKNGRVTNYI